MLVISRKEKEAFVIGNSIVVTVQRIKGSYVSVSIDAPREIPILRQEVWDEDQRQRELEGEEA